MSDVLHHLVRRGVELTQERYQPQNVENDIHSYQLPTWGIAMVWGTFLIYYIVMFAVSDTLTPSMLYT